MLDKENLERFINKSFSEIDNKIKKAENEFLNLKWSIRAKNIFGVTSKPHEAGYILYNGELLNFSGGYPDQRRIDHSEIYKIYTDEELEEANKKYRYGGIVKKFQDESNSIRVNVDRFSGYINLSIQNTQIITYEQFKTLEYIENYENEKHIRYDVYDENGYAVKSGEVSSVSELKKYYKINLKHLKDNTI